MKKTLVFAMMLALSAPLFALDIYEPLAQDSLWITSKGSAPFAANPTTTLYGQADYAINNSVLVGLFGQADYNSGIVNKVAGMSGIANVSSFADNKGMFDVIVNTSTSSLAAFNYALAGQVRGLLEGGWTPYAQLGLNGNANAGSQAAFSALGGTSFLISEQLEVISNVNVAFGGANVNPVVNMVAGSNWLLSDLLEFQVDLSLPLANAGNNVSGSFALYAGI